MFIAINTQKDTRPLQVRIDAASAGDVIEVFPGLYAEDLTISKALVFRGHGSESKIQGKHTITGNAVEFRDTFLCNTDAGVFEIPAAGNGKLKLINCNLSLTVTGVFTDLELFLLDDTAEVFLHGTDCEIISAGTTGGNLQILRCVGSSGSQTFCSDGGIFKIGGQPTDAACYIARLAGTTTPLVEINGARCVLNMAGPAPTGGYLGLVYSTNPSAHAHLTNLVVQPGVDTGGSEKVYLAHLNSGGVVEFMGLVTSETIPSTKCFAGIVDAAGDKLFVSPSKCLANNGSVLFAVDPVGVNLGTLEIY